MADREFLIKIVGDITDINKKVGSLEQNVSGFTNNAKTFAKGVAGAFAVGQVVDFGKQLVSSASDQEQAIGAANSVFGAYSQTIQDFSKTTADSIGISRGEFLQLSSVTGALIKGVGVPLDQTAESTKMLTSRAADMAAMFGGTTAEAMEAITSALKGERDPIEKYGVSLKQSAVDAKAAAMGYTDAEGKVTDVGRTMATMQLIMDKTADSAGTFAKESDTVAGSAQIMGAKWKDLQADLGKKLLPVIVKVTDVLVGLVEFVQKNQGWLLPVAAGILAVVAAVKAWSIAQAILNSALLANPIFLVVAAIAAIVAILVVAYNKVDWFRNAVDTAVDAVVGAFKWLWEQIKNIGDLIETGLKIYFAPFFLTYKLIREVWEHLPEVFGAVIRGVGTALNAVWNVITWPFRQAFDAAKGIIDQVPRWITGMVDGVRWFLGNLWSVISWPFQEGYRLAKQAIDDIIGVAQGIWGRVSSAMSGVADLLKWPFTAAFNAIKSLWNSTIGGFGFTVPSWVPFAGGKGFKIPYMAAGGIITRPTIAMLGEAGPEAVVPLGSATGFGNVTINVYALTANAEVGRKVYEALREYDRSTGKLPVG